MNTNKYTFTVYLQFFFYYQQILANTLIILDAIF